MDSECDAKEGPDVSGAAGGVYGGNLHYNVLVIKTKGVVQKTLVIPTLNGKLTPEQITAIIAEERAKMAAAAAAAVVADVSGEAIPATIDECVSVGVGVGVGVGQSSGPE